ncbi:MAG: hypothetical protein WBB45_21075 [Cyclobacteriaceae bacterium]
MEHELIYIVGMPLTLFVIWCAEMVYRGIWMRRATDHIYTTCQRSTEIVDRLQYVQEADPEIVRQRALHSLLSTFTGRPAKTELITETDHLLKLLIDLQESLPRSTPEVDALFDDCFHLIDRRGRVCQHILSMLHTERVADIGVFPYIQRNFISLVGDTIPHLEIECNMPNRRFTAHAEDDLVVALMALLTHAIYNRTPSSLHFYLVYAGSNVTLHMMDDDRHSETNLDLYNMAKEEWPPCYQIAHLTADMYKGYMIIDPTYTKGLHLELKLVLG